MNKAALSTLLRRLGLMHVADQLRYRVMQRQNREVNRIFRAANPSVPLPPDYLMYESFQLNYRKYYEGGRETAEWVKAHLAPHLALRNVSILDWGCGPGRVVRHLPAVVGSGCRFFGTDYNAKSIAWCRENIPGVTFLLNDLEPPLQAEAASFEAVYGISIFTHLSQASHEKWFEELMRVTKVGGVLLLTTHGDAFRAILTDEERQAFDAGELVIRSNVQEGHRVFTAFQPPQYFRKLVGPHAEILRHEPGQQQGGSTSQDVWLLRKTAN